MDSGAHLRCPALVRMRAPPDADHFPGHPARLKALKKFVFRGLPRTSSGKVQEYVLREEAKR